MGQDLLLGLWFSIALNVVLVIMTVGLMYQLDQAQHRCHCNYPPPPPRVVGSALLSFSTNLRGVPGMPLTIDVGKTSTVLLHEFAGPNGTGAELPPAGPLAYVSDNPAVASVDAATGVLTAVSAGTANVTGTDAADSQTATDVVTVVRPQPQSSTLTFSTPA